VSGGKLLAPYASEVKIILIDPPHNLLLTNQPFFFIEVVSKRQIAFERKAQADEKAQHT
jgi:hypothetical protein